MAADFRLLMFDGLVNEGKREGANAPSLDYRVSGEGLKVGKKRGWDEVSLVGMVEGIEELLGKGRCFIKAGKGRVSV